MAGQAALLTRESVKASIKSVECDKSKKVTNTPMSKKMSSQSKAE
jgi:hypothetical protein